MTSTGVFLHIQRQGHRFNSDDPNLVFIKQRHYRIFYETTLIRDLFADKIIFLFPYKYKYEDRANICEKDTSICEEKMSIWHVI